MWIRIQIKNWNNFQFKKFNFVYHKIAIYLFFDLHEGLPIPTFRLRLLSRQRLGLVLLLPSFISYSGGHLGSFLEDWSEKMGYFWRVNLEDVVYLRLVQWGGRPNSDLKSKGWNAFVLKALWIWKRGGFESFFGSALDLKAAQLYFWMVSAWDVWAGTCSSYPASNVADPWHFDTDPYRWLSDPDSDFLLFLHMDPAPNPDPQHCPQGTTLYTVLNPDRVSDTDSYTCRVGAFICGSSLPTHTDTPTNTWYA